MITQIFSVFPASGKTYLFEHQDELNLKILDSDSSEFSWMYRKRTWDEVNTAVKEWEAIPHKMSGLEYAIKITNEKIKVRNPDFPKNYIEHIKENIGKYDYIFVSSHKEVRDALDDAGIEFTIVFPEYKCKEEWFGRCCIREIEGKQGFDSTVLLNNWDKWWYDCAECGETHSHIVLRPTEHLSDRLWIKGSFSGTFF